jgi:hypothetical protein
MRDLSHADVRIGQQRLGGLNVLIGQFRRAASRAANSPRGGESARVRSRIRLRSNSASRQAALRTRLALTGAAARNFASRSCVFCTARPPRPPAAETPSPAATPAPRAKKQATDRFLQRRGGVMRISGRRRAYLRQVLVEPNFPAGERLPGRAQAKIPQRLAPESPAAGQ